VLLIATTAPAPRCGLTAAAAATGHRDHRNTKYIPKPLLALHFHPTCTPRNQLNQCGPGLQFECTATFWDMSPQNVLRCSTIKAGSTGPKMLPAARMTVLDQGVC
jgi:hypothetical protein